MLGASSAFGLGIGDKAPDLQVEEWVKGDPVDIHKNPGRLYLVEFWATWCGPCKQSIPLLTNIQKQFKDDLVIIGVTTPDMRGNSTSAIRRFVKKQGAAMDYTVAIDLGGKSSDAYMLASGSEGIPQAFLVEKTGKIVWIGSPLDPILPDVISQVLAGKYDMAAAKRSLKLDKLYQELAFPLQFQQWSQVQRILGEILKLDPANEQGIMMMVRLHADQLGDKAVLRRWVEGHIKSYGSDASAMAILAEVLSGNMDFSMRMPDLAIQAGRLAYEASGGMDSRVTAVYAITLHQIGKLDRAIELQRQAVDMAKNDATRERMQTILDFYLTCKSLQATYQ